jgi:Domain of unknown function (DUF4913)
VSDEDRLFSEHAPGPEHPDAAGPQLTASTADRDRAGAEGADANDTDATGREAIESAPPAEQLSDSIPGATLAYESVEDWVGRYLLVMYRRAVSGTGTTWCPQWWRHPEAVVRLEALWRAWEYLRKDSTTGMSVWLRDHCDPHMAQLLSADGPFKGCKPKQHSGHPNEPLPGDRAPTGWFEQTDEGDLPVAAVGRAR